MGGLIGEGLAEDRIGQAAGAKGLPEGFARVFGHHILAVIPWHQYHDMAGALATFVTAMDFTRRVLVVRVAHKGAREESGRPSYPSPLGSQSSRSKEVIRFTLYGADDIGLVCLSHLNKTGPSVMAPFWLRCVPLSTDAKFRRGWSSGYRNSGVTRLVLLRAH